MSLVRSQADAHGHPQISLISWKAKTTSTHGVVMSQIKDPESVAEHSFRVALLAMMFAPRLGITTEKAIKMGLIHDLAEAEIGDIVIQRGDTVLTDPDIKHEKERQAMSKIAEVTGIAELQILFDEYTAQITKEARLVKQLDRLEMLIQAYEYETEQEVDLEEFFTPTRKEISDPEIRVVLQELDSLRKEK